MSNFDVGMAGIETHEVVLNCLDAVTAGAVADLGTGQGALAEAMVARGYDVRALGFDPAQYRGSAPFTQCDLDAGIPFPDSSLSGAVAVEIIEHLESPNGFVRELARVVRPGGWIVLTTPNVLSIISRIAFLARGKPTQFGDFEYETNGHISPVSEHDLRRIAARVGLTVETVTYNVGMLPVPRVRHRMPLRGPFRNRALGQSLVIKLRNNAEQQEFQRG